MYEWATRSALGSAPTERNTNEIDGSFVQDYGTLISKRADTLFYIIVYASTTLLYQDGAIREEAMQRLSTAYVSVGPSFVRCPDPDCRGYRPLSTNKPNEHKKGYKLKHLIG